VDWGIRKHGGAMKSVIVAVIVLMIGLGLAQGREHTWDVDKFEACENKAGGGFFWVDTTTGRTWWADPFKMSWVFFGQPKGGTSGPAGTYIPYENKNGEGFFVLNTMTGEGWWTNGKGWKQLGKPVVQ